MTLQQSNGQIEKRNFGSVKVKLNELQGTTPCPFGHPSDSLGIGTVILKVCIASIDHVEPRLNDVGGYKIQQESA